MSERAIHKVETNGDTTGLREFANGQDSGIIIPSGTTPQRESNPVEGTMRYNTTLDGVEFYIGSSWVVLTENGVEDLIGDAAADGSTKGVSSYTTGEFTVTSGNVALGSVPATKLDGTTAEFNAALSDGSFATLAGSETIENKTFDTGTQTAVTIDLSDVAGGTLTFTGTTSEFNNALSDGSFATLAGTESLQSKTIDLGLNTLTGSTTEFNAALQSESFAYLQASQTIANKQIDDSSLGTALDAAQNAIENAKLKGYSETSQTLSTTAGTLTVNVASGNTGTLTLTEDVSTLAFTNVPTGFATFTLQVTQDAATPRLFDDGTTTTTYTVNGTGQTPQTAGGSGYTVSSTVGAIDLVTFIFLDQGAPKIQSLQDFQ